MDNSSDILSSIVYLGLPSFLLICLVFCCTGARFKLNSLIPKPPLRAKVTLEEGEIEIVDDLEEISRIQSTLGNSNTPGSRLSTSSAVINVGQPPEYGDAVLEEPRPIHRSESIIGQGS